MNTNSSADQPAFGIMGLGVMGRNLLLNLASHGFAVAGYNTPPKLELLKTGVGRIPGAVVHQGRSEAERHRYWSD